MKPYHISLIANVIQLLAIIALIVVIVVKKKCKECEKCKKCPSLPKGINLESLWTIPKPPSLHEKKVVYCSSGLFNLYEIMYTIGLSQLASKTGAASILADHVPWIYPDNKFAKEPKNSKLAFAINRIKDYMAFPTVDIPVGGLATAIAQYKGLGWKSYIPARDGFDMALFLGAAMAMPYSGLRHLIESGQLKGLTEHDWNIKAVSLLEAVYGFDMYNLLCRCNCFIFNADGIAMDDGSCAEIGIGTSRGMPLVIHHDQNTGNFPNHVINPMIAGAQGYNLSQEDMATSIPEAIEKLDVKMKKFLAEEQFEYYHYIPPPKVPSYWANVGYAVWSWKYKKYIIKDDGTLAAPKDIYSEEFDNWIGMGNNGKAYIVAKICLLVKAVQEKYKIVKSPAESLRFASMLSTAIKLK
jgi:hypothetical protein